MGGKSSSAPAPVAQKDVVTVAHNGNQAKDVVTQAQNSAATQSALDEQKKQQTTGLGSTPKTDPAAMVNAAQSMGQSAVITG